MKFSHLILMFLAAVSFCVVVVVVMISCGPSKEESGGGGSASVQQAPSSGGGTSPGVGIISDGDGDGVLDAVDNCPKDKNSEQINTDVGIYNDSLSPYHLSVMPDASGDVCDDDDDGDLILDINEPSLACRTDPSPTCGTTATVPAPDSNDRDGDGVSNAMDNCADVANPGQKDIDGDGPKLAIGDRKGGDACDECTDFSAAANGGKVSYRIHYEIEDRSGGCQPGLILYVSTAFFLNGESYGGAFDLCNTSISRTRSFEIPSSTIPLSKLKIGQSNTFSISYNVFSSGSGAIASNWFLRDKLWIKTFKGELLFPSGHELGSQLVDINFSQSWSSQPQLHYWSLDPPITKNIPACLNQ